MAGRNDETFAPSAKFTVQHVAHDAVVSPKLSGRGKRMSDARVRVSLTDGVIEFEGSETFVASLVDKFGGVIRTALGGEQLDVNEEPAASAPPAPDDSLGDIFAETDDGVDEVKLTGGTR